MLSLREDPEVRARAFQAIVVSAITWAPAALPQRLSSPPWRICPGMAGEGAPAVLQITLRTLKPYRRDLRLWSPARPADGPFRGSTNFAKHPFCWAAAD